MFQSGTFWGSKRRFLHSTIFSLVPFSTHLDIAPLSPLSRSEETRTLISWNPCPQRPPKGGMGSVTVTRGELHVWQPPGRGQVRLHLGSPPRHLCMHRVTGILSLGLTSFMGPDLALCPFHLKPESLPLPFPFLRCRSPWSLCSRSFSERGGWTAVS